MTIQTLRVNLLAFKTASELLDGFRDGSVRPSKVLDAHFEQIDRTNDSAELKINALSEEMRDQARETAEAADQRYEQAAGNEGELPPLLGVPIVSKEKHAITGHPISQGLVARQKDVAAENHPVIDRVLDAGAILHGRTTTPEFSCASVTHSRLWGVTRNPWNLQAGPGGSSGGAGAALASGMSTLATASDIGGSTRIPAGFNGLVGYKAPYGRIPGAAPLNADWYRSDGPMGRSVRDVALLTSVMAGRHPHDHTTWGRHGEDYLRSVGQGATGDLTGVRIAYSPDLGDYPVMPSIRRNTDAMMERAIGAGAEVVKVDVRLTVQQILDTIFAHFGHIMGNALFKQADGTVEDLSPYAREFVRYSSAKVEKFSLVDSLQMDAVIQHEIARVMAGFDVLITPTQSVEMLPADGNFLDGMHIEGRWFDNYMAAHMTMPFNTANRCPVMAIPSGMSSCGVPTSLQVVGHPFDEHTVFKVSAALESLSVPLGISPVIAPAT
ncbi:amidase [Arthrobacter sp. MMS24-S77]